MATRSRYDGQAEWYEEFASTGPFTELRRHAAGLLGPGPGLCLDLACGTGLARVVVVPLSHQAVQARERSPGRGTPHAARVGDLRVVGGVPRHADRTHEGLAARRASWRFGRRSVGAARRARLRSTRRRDDPC